MRSLLCFCFLFVHYSLIGIEYIYPIGSYGDTIILYIQQISPHHIELWQWDTITNDTQLLLCSLFNPAEVKLLPNNKGFSFLDNGRLRLKLFQKRSPKAIDFDQPLFNFNGLNCIDEHTGYCSAKYINNFSLFQIDDDGRVEYLVSGENQDFMWPQKVNHQLFYICREKKEEDTFNYKIMQSPYGKNSPPETVINFSDKSIVSLSMLSPEEGFVIHYTQNKDNFDFFYYHLIKKGDNTWKNKHIFSFSLPTYLFIGKNDHRLFESILPLLPRIIDYKIYFCDYASDSDRLELYCYDLSLNQRDKVSLNNKQEHHIFAPIKCGTHIYCGGIKSNFDTAYKIPLFLVF